MEQKRAKTNIFEIKNRETAAERRPNDAVIPKKETSPVVVEGVLPKRKATVPESGQCLFASTALFPCDSRSSDFRDIYVAVAREIELHEFWINEYQNAKQEFVEFLYQKFQRITLEFFRSNFKVP